MTRVTPLDKASRSTLFRAVHLRAAMQNCGERTDSGTGCHVKIAFDFEFQAPWSISYALVHLDWKRRVEKYPSALLTDLDTQDLRYWAFLSDSSVPIHE